MDSVFDYLHYVPYLRKRLEAEGARSGIKGRAAAALRVHTTFISLVLTGRAHLSAEQADLMNSFLGHSVEEADFFLLLVLKDRAGTVSLREKFQKKLDEILSRRLVLKERVKDAGSISPEDQVKFYSSYLYGAIHILAAIPGYQTRAALAEALRFPLSRVSEAVDFLLKLGLLVEKSGRLAMGTAHVHLGSDSDLITKHHSNWRTHTLMNLEHGSADDLHYSGAISLSRDDATRLRKILVDTFKQNVDLIRKSKAEVAYVYSFDFYPLLPPS